MPKLEGKNRKKKIPPPPLSAFFSSPPLSVHKPHPCIYPLHLFLFFPHKALLSPKQFLHSMDCGNKGEESTAPSLDRGNRKDSGCVLGIHSVLLPEHSNFSKGNDHGVVLSRGKRSADSSLALHHTGVAPPLRTSQSNPNTATTAPAAYAPVPLHSSALSTHPLLSKTISICCPPCNAENGNLVIGDEARSDCNGEVSHEPQGSPTLRPSISFSPQAAALPCTTTADSSALSFDNLAYPASPHAAALFNTHSSKSSLPIARKTSSLPCTLPAMVPSSTTSISRASLSSSNPSFPSPSSSANVLSTPSLPLPLSHNNTVAIANLNTVPPNTIVVSSSSSATLVAATAVDANVLASPSNRSAQPPSLPNCINSCALLEPFDGCEDMRKGRTKLFKFAVPPGVPVEELPGAVKFGEKMEFYMLACKVKISFRCISGCDSALQGLDVPLRSHGRDRHALTCPSGLHYLDNSTALIRLGPDDSHLRYILCNTSVNVFVIWERLDPSNIPEELALFDAKRTSGSGSGSGVLGRGVDTVGFENKIKGGVCVNFNEKSVPVSLEGSPSLTPRTSTTMEIDAVPMKCEGEEGEITPPPPLPPPPPPPPPSSSSSLSSSLMPMIALAGAENIESAATDDKHIFNEKDAEKHIISPPSSMTTPSTLPHTPMLASCSGSTAANWHSAISPSTNTPLTISQPDFMTGILSSTLHSTEPEEIGSTIQTMSSIGRVLPTTGTASTIPATMSISTSALLQSDSSPSMVAPTISSNILSTLSVKSHKSDPCLLLDSPPTNHTISSSAKSITPSCIISADLSPIQPPTCTLATALPTTASSLVLSLNQVSAPVTQISPSSFRFSSALNSVPPTFTMVSSPSRSSPLPSSGSTSYSSSITKAALQHIQSQASSPTSSRLSLEQPFKRRISQQHQQQASDTPTTKEQVQLQPQPVYPWDDINPVSVFYFGSCAMVLRGRNFMGLNEKLPHKNPSTLCRCCYRESSNQVNDDTCLYEFICICMNMCE